MERFKERVENKLQEIMDLLTLTTAENKKSISSLTKKIESLMAKQSDFKAVLDRIDAATNGVAAELTSLKEQIKGLGLDASVEDQILSTLTAQANKLEGLGKDDVPADAPPATPPATTPGA